MVADEKKEMKKEYIAPQMTLEEYECQNSLLACSGPDMVVCDDSDN